MFSLFMTWYGFGILFSCNIEKLKNDLLIMERCRADLANLVNEAALLAGRKSKLVVEKIDFIQAVERSIAVSPSCLRQAHKPRIVNFYLLFYQHLITYISPLLHCALYIYIFAAFICSRVIDLYYLILFRELKRRLPSYRAVRKL